MNTVSIWVIIQETIMTKDRHCNDSYILFKKTLQQYHKPKNITIIETTLFNCIYTEVGPNSILYGMHN